MAKETQLQIRCSHAQKALLKEEADRKGQSVSEFVLEKTLGPRVLPARGVAVGGVSVGHPSPPHGFRRMPPPEQLGPKVPVAPGPAPTSEEDQASALEEEAKRIYNTEGVPMAVARRRAKERLS